MRKYLPEYGDYQLIPIYGGLNMKEETVEELTRNGIYAMVFGGDIVDIINLRRFGKKGALTGTQNGGYLFSRGLPVFSIV